MIKVDEGCVYLRGTTIDLMSELSFLMFRIMVTMHEGGISNEEMKNLFEIAELTATEKYLEKIKEEQNGI